MRASTWGSDGNDKSSVVASGPAMSLIKSGLIVAVVALIAIACGDSGTRRDASPAASSGGSQAGDAAGRATGGTGGSTTNRSCPTAFVPCGGDVTGTWHLTLDECLFGASSFNCAGESFALSPSSTATASYTFAAGGTVSASIQGSFVGTYRYPPRCLLSDAGAEQACADLDRVLQTAYPQLGDAGVDNLASIVVHCSAEAGGICACEQNATYVTRTTTGTFSTNGTKITFVGTGGLAPGGPNADAGVDGPYDYCVSGNQLTLAASNSSGTVSIEVWTR